MENKAYGVIMATVPWTGPQDNYTLHATTQCMEIQDGNDVDYATIA